MIVQQRKQFNEQEHTVKMSEEIKSQKDRQGKRQGLKKENWKGIERGHSKNEQYHECESWESLRGKGHRTKGEFYE